MLEHDRRVESEGVATRNWLARVLLCWLIFQVILATSVLKLFLSGNAWSYRLYGQVAASPCAAMIFLSAGIAAVIAIRHSGALSRPWLVLSLLPWALVAAQAAAVAALWMFFP